MKMYGLAVRYYIDFSSRFMSRPVNSVDLALSKIIVMHDNGVIELPKDFIVKTFNWNKKAYDECISRHENKLSLDDVRFCTKTEKYYLRTISDRQEYLAYLINDAKIKYYCKIKDENNEKHLDAIINRLEIKNNKLFRLIPEYLI